jgi:hypothetical protein
MLAQTSLRSFSIVGLSQVAEEPGVLGPHRSLASLLRLDVEAGDHVSRGTALQRAVLVQPPAGRSPS